METFQMSLLKCVECYEPNVIAGLQNNASLPFLCIFDTFVFSKAN